MSHEALYKAFGKSVKIRREKLRMTQEQLAQKVGISRASIANIEGGRQNVLLHHVYRIASALEFSKPSELLPADLNLVAEDGPEMTLTGADDVTARELHLINSLYQTTKVRPSPKADA
jgi:transcriptional regulator with XRE-family HTH domain